MSKKSTRGLTAAIREYLTKNPGSKYSDIRTAMMKLFRFSGSSENRISATLSQMFTHESVRRTGKTGSFAYFVRGSR